MGRTGYEARGGIYILSHDISYLGVFVRRALQCLPPGGDVVEEILDDNQCSLVTSAGLGLGSCPCSQGNHLAITVCSPTGGRRDNVMNLLSHTT